MRVLSTVLIGACLMTTPSLAIDKQEAQKGADEWAAAFKQSHQPNATGGSVTSLACVPFL
jgi:hypothetical protein